MTKKKKKKRKKERKKERIHETAKIVLGYPSKRYGILVFERHSSVSLVSTIDAFDEMNVSVILLARFDSRFTPRLHAMLYARSPRSFLENLARDAMGRFLRERETKRKQTRRRETRKRNDEIGRNSCLPIVRA